MRMVTFGKSRVIRRDRVRRQGLGIVALCPFYSCWVESGGLGDPVASRAWCVQAAAMLACPAVLEDPDAGRSWLPGDLAVAVRALQAHRVKCAERRAWPACRVLAGEEECMESAPSRTAMFAAVSRGLFRLETASPWVLDDVLALVLVGPVWQQLRDQFDPLFPGPVRREARAAVCTRSRYAEDRLAAGAFTQYVILGAGLDSFAWRRPDLLGSLTVFEVDHPASQAWKLERVRELGLPLSDSQVFVPVDFEAGPVQDVLGPAGFDWAQPAMFCWTGVAPYLTAQAIESTLRSIAAAAPGSEVVFSYRAEDCALDDAGTEYARIYTPIAASVGEPLQPGWPVSEIERLIGRCGLTVADHPARADLQQRYFAGRTDGLRPYTFETLVAARVA